MRLRQGFAALFFNPHEGTPIFLITVFAKNEKANLTAPETAAVKALGELLSATHRRTR